MSRKILIAEDSPATQKFISFTLKYKGHDVTIASDGVEALEKLPQGTYDLVILDIMMPRMNGLEVLREIKKRPETSRIPVIMLTSEKGEADRQTALSLGARFFLNKPFQPEQLLEAIDKVFA
jgi:CheY-like chemotaxis protein